ncbi:hypothetical protein [Aureivirga sp. CE67]|uniref:hypothetical protein n=1 Tax=Aureivirga sp. CE67 TaxID=1788983 RepID=UPI0018C9E2EB|nr:hypothetical protein [Aureivirga sp. CE67]
MKLYTVCSSCKEEIKIKSFASTRPELQMEKGREFNVNCQNCGVFEKKHINDVKAEIGKLMLLIIGFSGIAFAVFLFFFLGMISSLISFIPMIFWQQEVKAVRSFNSYLVKR